MEEDDMETWEIFMKLCEEFPELYEKYVEKIEQEMQDHKPDYALIDESKKRVWEKLQKRIHDQN